MGFAPALGVDRREMIVLEVGYVVCSTLMVYLDYSALWSPLNYALPGFVPVELAGVS